MSSTTPFVYSCPAPDGRIFATAVRDCSIPEKFTVQATTRQLLVGLTNLNIVSQRPIEVLDRPALLSVIEGQLDAIPVTLATITTRTPENNAQCISDVVAWRSRNGGDKNGTPDELEKTALSLATSLTVVDSRIVDASG